jgi:transposase
MVEATTHVGLDVHKQSISVAMLLPGSTKTLQWEMRNEPGEVRRLVRRLRREGGDEGELLCAYEAGPCGYVLQRQLVREGVGCQVVAASLIPRKPGERIKTDRRDARKLAELLRAGLLTEVRPPSQAEEALRDLCRCREDACADLMRARHRLGKMLLRQGLRYVEGKPWTAQHRAWLWSLKLEHAAERMVLEDYLLAVEQVSTRLATLEAQLGELAEQEPYRERVGWLRCFRGIDTITALSVLAELHGFERFQKPRQLMAYLGLVPSESSSGTSVHRGAITKTGNRHLRRLLTEAAHHSRHRPSVGAALRRSQGRPAGGRHRAGGPGATAPASPLQPTAVGPWSATAEGGDRVCAGARRLSLGRFVLTSSATTGHRALPSQEAANAQIEIRGREPARRQRRG